MKLMHLSDLHLGKRVNEYSMLPDQKYILDQILCILDAEQPDALLIAGDVYDKSVAPAEAIELFDGFLVALAARKVPTFVSSGNHDSPERLAFGGRLMDAKGIYLSPVYDGTCRKVTLEDAHGQVDIYMLPFVKPSLVRRFFPEQEISSYTDAVTAAVHAMEIDTSRRNVLLAHQFVTGANTCESEELSVGGLENVDASVFEGFDYVALGHIHGPQNVGSQRIRYCGTPLKYSFSECSHQKSVTLAQLEGPGQLTLRTVPLIPRRDLAVLRGSFAELTDRVFWENTTWPEDYTHIVLTDEEEIPEAMSKLRPVYHNIMKLSYDNTRTRANRPIAGDAQVKTKSPLELFSDFFRQQNNRDMGPEQTAYITDLITSIWEEDV